MPEVALTAPKRPSSRETALETVRDVFGAEKRSAQEAFDYRVRRAGLDARDRAFATELAYGAIKMRRTLDWFLAPYISDREKPLPPAIHEVLRLGVYQVRFMGGVEPHAAVFETVNLALRHGHRGTAGLVNAVLRRFIADAPADPQPADFESEDEYNGVRFSVPTWVAARLRNVFGERCEAILAGINGPPQHAIRVNAARADVETVIATLAAMGVRTERSAFVDDVLIASASVADDPQGRWTVQSESSSLPVDLLDPKAGARALDLCSGRGHKTAQIAARIGEQGTVESVELDPRKAAVQQTLLERVGAATVALVVGDANAVSREADADAVLLDAPCSGLGILGRHPEARWRKAPDDSLRLGQLQSVLLRTAARRTKPGGRLVYSVCSPDPREGPELIDIFLRDAPSFTRAPLPARYAPLERNGDVLVAPGIDGRDGFYIAVLERSR